MVGSRTPTAIVGLIASVAISAAARYYLDTVLLFLLVPFLPLPLRRREAASGGHDTVRECPACGFRTGERGYEYCPRDGTRPT